MSLDRTPSHASSSSLAQAKKSASKEQHKRKRDDRDATLELSDGRRSQRLLWDYVDILRRCSVLTMLSTVHSALLVSGSPESRGYGFLNSDQMEFPSDGPANRINGVPGGSGATLGEIQGQNAGFLPK